MHISNVIIDGFKSYADRTDIGVFDPHFNAITGLNGSGKSNILDGIIFVLGLSSLNTVRAQSLADLIHKGSTQCKKAQVTLVFNNRDKRPGKCPPGFEKFNEIVVTRTIEPGLVCKYHLNAHVSTKKAIQDMFESVHLNINNPNFMIMQGKITKVVNMKPKELLHMIEETVGALSYQTKRDKSCKEIQEKERQLESTSRVMDEVVRPAISRQLKAARFIDEYKFSRIKLDKMTENYALVSYYQHTKDLTSYTAKLHKLENIDKGDDDRIAEIKELIGKKNIEQEAIKKESNLKVKEKLASLEKTKGLERKKLAGLEAKFEAANENVETCKGKVKTAEKAHQDEIKQMEDFNKKMANIIAEFTTNQNDITTAEENLKSAKEQESELNTGKILGDDGKAINLRDRLVVVEDELGKIRPNHDHEAKLLANDTKILKQRETELAKTPSDAQIEKDFKVAEKELLRIKNLLAQKHLIPEQYPILEKRADELKGIHYRLEQEMRGLTRNNAHLIFNYRDPYPNFNKAAVHGSFFELFEVKDMDTFGKAVEVATGGNLVHVIVDTPEISKALISKGDLARRTTFLPLSAIKNSSAPVTQAELDRALGRNKAFPAMDCLDFDPKYQKVIQHYCGYIVFCVDQPTAKYVAFQMRYKAITLDGDVISSDGIMQGGYRHNVGEMISACSSLRRVFIQEREVRRELHEIEAKIGLYNREGGLLDEFARAERNLKNASDLRQCTAYAALKADIEQLQETIKTRSAQVKTWADEMLVWRNEQKSLTEKLDHFEDIKAKSMKATQALIQKWSRALEAAKRKYELKQTSFKEIELELKSKETLIETSAQDAEQAKKDLVEAEEHFTKQRTLLDEAKAVFQAKDADYEDAVREAQLLNDQVAGLATEIENLQQKIQSVELSKMTRDNSRKEIKEALHSLKCGIDSLRKKHPNVDFESTQKPDFVPNPRGSLTELRRNIDKMEKELEEKRLRLDYASAGKADESQSLLTTALEKIAQVEKNRTHIQEAIQILDVQKMNLVNNAFDSINHEFGAMMQTLLPESHAKLVPVKPGDLEAGVNIHVCLGGVWKESLSELSGGQRSLVALALVLSLCLFCPAPFYVLDEIDAALDMSHTQNIGIIIQQRFKDTQFICVSLKDGMYSNANVLFQTSFANGKSSISRSYSVKK